MCAYHNLYKMRHPYTIRLAKPSEEKDAFLVEREVWAPFNWMAEGGVGLNYDPAMHLVAVDDDEVVANIDAFGFEWDGDPKTLPEEGWRAAIIAAQDGFSQQPAWACAHGASILVKARQGGLAADLLVALRDKALSLGYQGLVAPVRPTFRAKMPHLTIEEYAEMRLPDGRHFDPWIRTHERVGGKIIGTSTRSMYWYGERKQWEEWAGLKLPDNGKLLIDGSTGWLEIIDGFGTLVEDSVWLCHLP
jgi:hypothetical protein